MSSESTPKRILPVYETPQPNVAVELYSGPMTLRSKSEEIGGEGTLRLEWLPSPALRFRLRAPGELSRDLRLAFRFSDIEESQLDLAEIGQRVASTALATKSGSNSELEVSGIVNGEIVTGNDKRLSFLLFHLPNVPEFGLAPDSFVETVGRGAHSVQRIRLPCDKWVVTLDPVRTEKGFLNEVRSARGYALTSVGRLEQENGRTFSLKQAEPILEVLQHVLSFALHRWCTPLLLVGCNRKGKPLCEAWSAGRASPFQVHRGWFDFHHSIALAELLPVMHGRWNDKHWQQILRDVIYWYVEMHEQPVRLETGIMLGQITLEMLGWHRLVEDSPTLSEGAFANLPAADKLKLLLSFCSIPIAPPDELKELRRVSSAENWQGPDAIVAIRNRVVHQNRKKREQSDKKRLTSHDMLSQAYTLICRYVELVLLHLLEYEGGYSNRMKKRWVGTVEPVPWAIPINDSSTEV